MNVTEILQEIGELSVNNPRLSSNYIGFLNRAQRMIAQRGNFNGSHDLLQVTMPSGQSAVDLGPTFKAVTSETSGVAYINPAGSGRISVQVSSRAKCNRWWTWWNFPWYSASQPYLPPRVVFIEQNAGGNYYMNLPPLIVAQADINFEVECYTYPAPLKNGNDTNWMTEHGQLCDALINLVRNLAFRSINQFEEAAISYAEYEKYYLQARYADTRQRSSGRALNM